MNNNNVANKAILKEHDKNGHVWHDHTDDLERFNIDTVTKRIYTCSCGWMGWFKVEDLVGR